MIRWQLSHIYHVSVPYRGATFLNFFPEFYKTLSAKVSVPYRGATFLNPTELQWYVHSYIVSVPSRGATFLNTDKIFLTLQAHTFPSPIGELHFSMCYYFSLCYLLLVSVPYRGATFLNSATLTFKCSRFIVSVPYRGATFLNERFLELESLLTSFRPLSASYMSNYNCVRSWS